MFLNELEIRRIIRKNILTSCIVNEATTMGGYNYKSGSNITVYGVAGFKMVAKDSAGKVQSSKTLFIPNTFPKSGIPKMKDSDGAFTIDITDENEIKEIKAMFETETDIFNTVAISADTKVLTPEMKDLLSYSAEEIFTHALSSSKYSNTGDLNYVAYALKTMNKKFRELNKSLNKQFGKDSSAVGMFIGSPDANSDNILKSPHDGTDHAASIAKLDDAIGNVDYVLDAAYNPEVLTDLINDYIGKGISILQFAELSFQYSKLGDAYRLSTLSKGIIGSRHGNGSIIDGYLRSSSSDAGALFGNSDSAVPSSGSLRMLANPALLTKLPLFYLKLSTDKTVPVFLKGPSGYEAILARLVDGLAGKTSGTTSQDQKVKTGGEPGIKTKTKTKRVDGGTETETDRVGGINMSVEVDGSPNIKNLDDLGYKVGTDKALRIALRRLVKSERKFKGTGDVNLDVIFNKRGKVIKVGFRKGLRGGQSRSALKQTERARSRIKEYLNNASFEDFKVTDPDDPTDTTTFNDPVSRQWFLASGIKDKLVKLSRDRYKFNLIIAMF